MTLVPIPIPTFIHWATSPEPSWYQLEPCRHYICGECADEYMQERGEDTCPECRQEVVLYLPAESGT